MKTWLTYAVNAEMFWSKLPFLERLNRIADAGFEPFEFWGYADKDVTAIAELSAARDLKPVQFVAGWGLNSQKAKATLLASLPKAVAAAKQLNVEMMTVVAGDEIKGVPRAKQTEDVLPPCAKRPSSCKPKE